MASSRCVRYAGYIHISKRMKIQTSTTNLVFHACSAPFHARSLKLFFFLMQTHEKETQLAIMFCVRSPLLCKKATACYPSLKTTTTRGLIVGFFDLKHRAVNQYPVPLSAADILLAVPDPAPPPLPPRGCDKLIFSRQFGPRSGPTKCLMFCSRTKGADKTVRCAG